VKRGGGVFRQLGVFGVCALYLQVIDQNRGSDDRCGHSSFVIAYEQIISSRNQIIPQSTGIQLVKNRAAH
jgi:hypothetical protein